jgi:heme O synthase-like polyprenyltransferase
MRHKIIRIIIGIIWLVVGAVTLIRGSMEWWYSGIFVLLGVVFLLSAFKGTQNKQ